MSDRKRRKTGTNDETATKEISLSVKKLNAKSGYPILSGADPELEDNRFVEVLDTQLALARATGPVTAQVVPGERTRGFWVSATSRFAQHLWLPNRPVTAAVSNNQLFSNASLKQDRCIKKTARRSYIVETFDPTVAGRDPQEVLGIQSLFLENVTKPTEKSHETGGMKNASIIFRPQEQDRQKLVNWMGTYRWTYNQCVAYSCRNPEITGASLRQTLREGFVVRKGLKEKGMLWVLETPEEVRDRAVREFLSNLNTQKKLVKEKKKVKFKMGFKKKHRDFKAYRCPIENGGDPRGHLPFYQK
jgi:hypothetical protein